MKRNNCIKLAKKIHKTEDMKKLDKFLIYYEPLRWFPDITSMKWYLDLEYMLKHDDFHNTLTTMNELMYLNQLNYINLFLDVKDTLNIIIKWHYFLQETDTILSYEIKEPFLSDIKTVFYKNENNQLLNKFYV